MLSIPERKNPFGVLEAFDKLCSTQKGNAHLVLKLSNLDRCSNEIRQQILSYLDRLPITLIDKYLKRQQLTSLMAACDCYLSMHRSEGFGLPLAEAMFLGVPVVATGWSSNMDFMTLNNSYPIKYDLVELDQDYGPYSKGSVWANPDVDHAVSCLLEVMTQPEVAQKKVLRALSDIKQFNSTESVGKRIKSRVDVICNIN
jgi:glycosyltransferase involved in cell wall biosynthesis